MRIEIAVVLLAAMLIIGAFSRAFMGRKSWLWLIAALTVISIVLWGVTL